MDFTDAQQKLMDLMFQIFEDDVMDEQERAQLNEFWNNQDFTPIQVRQVVESFVAKVWQDVVEDGVVTIEEQQRLQNVVSALRLPPEALPDELRDALGRGQ